MDPEDFRKTRTQQRARRGAARGGANQGGIPDRVALPRQKAVEPPPAEPGAECRSCGYALGIYDHEGCEPWAPST